MTRGSTFPSRIAVTGFSPVRKPLDRATSRTVLIRCASRRAVSGFAVQIGDRQASTSGCPMSETGNRPMIGKA